MRLKDVNYSQWIFVINECLWKNRSKMRHVDEQKKNH